MQTLNLRLLNYHFEVPCEADEQDKLHAAAAMLNAKLDQVPHLKGEHKVLMVALNICYDYLQMKNDTLDYIEKLEHQLDALTHAPDTANAPTDSPS
ncbi:cell division protein ZapA [Thiomicrospira microaerophila]|uniref:cell division protein ZapA n=1 Tax=Thiomicrospira microaerophila TaxID=406020 RepID=UPI0005C8DA68|nr:cell division protein ZapA [Thiomicrospira microaerophila]